VREVLQFRDGQPGIAHPVAEIVLPGDHDKGQVVADEAEAVEEENRA